MSPRSLPSPGRRLSGTERLWLIADRVCPPFVNQLVLEADTGDLHATDWVAALSAATDATPSASFRLRGILGRTRWTSGPPPRCQRESGADWTGTSGGGAPFLSRRLDPRTGPSVELVLLDGPRPRLVLRTHHALMDGRGTLLLAQRLCAAAHGGALHPEPGNSPTDVELARALSPPRPKPPTRECPSPLGFSREAPLAVRWATARIEGALGPRLLSRVVVAIAQRAPVARRSTVRIDVPVDLRRHGAGSDSTANLTGLLRVPVGSLLLREDPVSATHAWIAQALAEHREAAFPCDTDPVRGLPLSWVAALGRRGAALALRQDRFSATATVSNLGVLPLDRMAAPGFEPSRGYFIPPGSPGLPLFLTLCGDPTGVTLCGASPLGLADGGRLEALLHDVVRHVRASAPGNANAADDPPAAPESPC